MPMRSRSSQHGATKRVSAECLILGERDNRRKLNAKLLNGDLVLIGCERSSHGPPHRPARKPAGKSRPHRCWVQAILGGRAQKGQDPRSVPRSRANSSTILWRTASRSAGTCFMFQPSTETASSIRRWISWVLPKIHEFRGRAAPEPSTTSGNIGTCSRIANWNGPSLKGRTFPSGDRVPSGKKTTEHRWRRYRAHCNIAFAPLRRSDRSIGTSPAMRSIQPTKGNRNNSALASHFVSSFKWAITGMSAMD